MTSINYIAGIIKILELPRQELLENNILITRFRGQLPLLRTTQIIELMFWGNFAQDVTSYCKMGDYLLVEGYISLVKNETLNYSSLPMKKVQLTVSKAYPLYTNLNDSTNTINYTSDY
jgi:hypothetical protein|uniref:Single-stranded DNA-binding protein n=1 Tax=Fistulifera solaris TaxID=1519565 RepID=F3Y7I3_FISSO|nr:hypothetical protein FispC_p097 [Fistulifera solaris]BAK19028.1 conserved hypothetical protein [Fistulifera solaris]